MPDGWVVHSKTGKPINDPKKVGEGVLLPIGGYKGSGLALIIGLLAGVLNGAAFGRDVIDFTKPGTEEDQHRPVHGRRSTSSASCRRRCSPPKMDRHLTTCDRRQAVARRRRDPHAGRGPPPPPRGPHQERRRVAGRCS